MKQRGISYVAGMLTMLAITLMTTSALAISGQILFNQVSVISGEKQLATAQESWQAPSGAMVPSSISYTDETGALTNYLPVRTLSTHVQWDEETQVISLIPSCLQESISFPQNKTHSEWDIMDFIKSMEPISPDKAPNLLEETSHQADEPFSTTLPLDEEKGQYISVTVTNEEDRFYSFNLGVAFIEDEGNMVLSYVIEPYETKTYTVHIHNLVPETISGLYILAGHISCEDVSCPNTNTNLTISAVQFDVT